MASLAHTAALIKGKKTEVEKAVGDINKTIQKGDLFSGHSKKYFPYKDEGPADRKPPTTVMVRCEARDLLQQAIKQWSELWDLTAAQDKANQQATADIKFRGDVLLAAVPVTTLLFLQKQLADVKKLLENLPTPDPAVEWVKDDVTGVYRSKEERVSQAMAKQPKVIVKYDATKEHPAQTDVIYSDLPIGEWREVLFSGALPANAKVEMLVIVDELLESVKIARQDANKTSAPYFDVAKKLFDVITAPLTKTK